MQFEKYNDFTTIVNQYLKARIPIINLNTIDESFALSYLEEFCTKEVYNLHVWNNIDGICSKVGKSKAPNQKDTTNIVKILKYILNVEGETQCRGDIFVILDIEYYLDDPHVSRLLKKIYEEAGQKTIMFIEPFIEFSSKVNLKFSVKNLTLPHADCSEYEAIFNKGLEVCRKKCNTVCESLQIKSRQIIDNMKALTIPEASCYLSLIIIEEKDKLNI